MGKSELVTTKILITGVENNSRNQLVIICILLWTLQSRFFMIYIIYMIYCS